MMLIYVPVLLSFFFFLRLIMLIFAWFHPCCYCLLSCCPPGEHQPPLSSDSDTSLILPVEVSLSDVELSAEAEQEEAKSWVTQPGCYRGTAFEGAPMELNMDQDQDGGAGVKKKKRKKEHKQYFLPYGRIESQKRSSRSLWSHQVGLDVSSLLVLHYDSGKSTQRASGYQIWLLRNSAF